MLMRRAALYTLTTRSWVRAASDRTWPYTRAQRVACEVEQRQEALRHPWLTRPQGSSPPPVEEDDDEEDKDDEEDETLSTSDSGGYEDIDVEASDEFDEEDIDGEEVEEDEPEEVGGPVEAGDV